MENRALLQVLKALAEPQRFRMIQEIAAAGELSCRQLGKRIRLAQPTISHHVKVAARGWAARRPARFLRSFPI